MPIVPSVSGGQPITSSWGNAVVNEVNAVNYRTGIWTPALTFATPGNLAVAYSMQVGRYTRIGDMVLFIANISTSTFTHSTAAGAFRLIGFPFNINVDAGAFAGFTGWAAAGYSDVGLILRAGQTYAEFHGEGSGQGLLVLTSAHMPTGTTVHVRASGIYRTLDA